MRTQLNHSIALLVGRVALGAIFVAHGWQKLNTFGIEGVQGSFTQMGVPLPEASAYFATFVELVGGVLLIAGALTPVAAGLLALNMFGALFTVHLENGIFVGDGGYELVLALGAGALVIALLGAGRFSVDAVAATALGKKAGPVAAAA